MRPRDMSERGVAYVPGDRHRFGLVLSFPIADNLVLTDYYDAPYAYGVVRNDEAIEARASGADRRVRHPDPVGRRSRPSTLSGGNQQKLDRRPRVQPRR